MISVLHEEERSLLLKLGHQAIAAYLRGDQAAHDANIPADSYYGAFVTIRSNGELRGCIGEIHELRGDLGRVVAELAVASATRDTRFDPVDSSELEDLRLEISLLEKPVPVSDLRDLNPSEFGVIVASGHRRGVLLPGIPEVTTPEMQLEIARKKARISQDEPVTILRFRVSKVVDL